MRTYLFRAALAPLLGLSLAIAQQPTSASALSSPDDQYVLGPDSLPQAGVPKGKVFEFTLDRSRVFPGTRRQIAVYVPAEYDGKKPACVYVGLDGLKYQVPAVFDNLIYKREMPVTIGIGLPPGAVDSAEPVGNPRFNRSLEFDGLSGDLARFMMEEVLPAVERHQTPDGRRIVLSKDPNDRAAGGGSTGGIGAFTLAWQRPDVFRRVFTSIGTFVGMRGGDRYPVVVRKTEPKPIRIFMQDGSHDGLDPFLGEVGDWWMSNQAMLRSLTFAGYQVEHVWGEGTHNDRHAAAVFPAAMRWLWKDWPHPVVAGTSQNVFLKAILAPGEAWEAVPGVYQSAGILAADRSGQILFRNTLQGRCWMVGTDARLREWGLALGSNEALAFGPDGSVYCTDAGRGKLLAMSSSGHLSTIAEGVRASSLLVTHRGYVYLTETGEGPLGQAVLIKPSGEKIRLDSGLNHPSGIALSPDGQWLAVVERSTHWGYSYRVSPDGTVTDKQRFYWFHVPDEADDSGAGPSAMDREGRFYVATRMGVQVFDRNGRSRAILPVPGGEVIGLTFGGGDDKTLYVSCADHRLYRRKFQVAGQPAWSEPIKLPPWGAG